MSAWVRDECVGDGCVGDECVGDECVGDECVGDECVGAATTMATATATVTTYSCNLVMIDNVDCCSFFSTPLAPSFSPRRELDRHILDRRSASESAW
jgi:hypothetical protein